MKHKSPFIGRQIIQILFCFTPRSITNHNILISPPSSLPSLLLSNADRIYYHFVWNHFFILYFNISFLNISNRRWNNFDLDSVYLLFTRIYLINEYSPHISLTLKNHIAWRFSSLVILFFISLYLRSNLYLPKLSNERNLFVCLLIIGITLKIARNAQKTSVVRFILRSMCVGRDMSLACISIIVDNWCFRMICMNYRWLHHFFFILSF